VSTNGGYQPFWRGARELYYLDPAGRLMRADVPAQGAINPARQVLQTRVITPGASRNHYALHPTSAGLVLVNSPVHGEAAASLTVAFNWPALKRQ
jgi:hypothetical protein